MKKTSKRLPAVAAWLACSLATLSFPTSAATDLVVDGDFQEASAAWTHSAVPVEAGAAWFDAGADALSQTFEGLAGGSELRFSFLYERVGAANGAYLRYDVLFSRDGFATSTSLLGGPVAFTHARASGPVSHSDLLLPTAGDVRILFAGGHSARSFAIDDVALTASAPVAEPETYAMLLAGLGALGVMARRRRR